MFYILKDAVAELGKFVDNGSCSREKIVERINEAIRRLIERPNSPVNMTRYMRYCTKNDTITLPREAEKALWCDIDGGPSPIFDMPYEFLSDGPGALANYGDTIRQYLKDEGDYFPTFFDIPSLTTDEDASGSCGCSPSCDAIVHVPRKIIAVAKNSADRNQEIRLLGKDTYWADILTNGVPGEVLKIGMWENGVEGTLNKQDFPPISENAFMDIVGVIKPVTKDYVSLYTYDADTDRLYFLAKYHPDETRPRYRRYKLTQPNYTDGTCVRLLVRLRYVPAKHDNDILLVQSPGALKLMIMAINRENEREIEESLADESRALQILRDQHSNNKNYYTQVQVIGPWGFRGVNLRG